MRVLESIQRPAPVRRRLGGVFGLIVLTTACFGCDRLFLAKPPETQEGSYLVHIVSAGDVREDIQTIVLWYTGSEDNVAAIQIANPGVDLSALSSGQRIMLPLSLVTQTNAMPRRKFTLGVDVPPPPPVRDAPDAIRGAKRGDPLEELMQKQEQRQRHQSYPNQVEPVRVVPTPPQVPPSTTIEKPKPIASPVGSKPDESTKLESFTDEEIGDLSSGLKQPGVVQQRQGDVSARGSQTAPIKNPRSKREPQPEVFDEE